MYHQDRDSQRINEMRSILETEMKPDETGFGTIEVDVRRHNRGIQAYTVDQDSVGNETEMQGVIVQNSKNKTHL